MLDKYSILLLKPLREVNASKAIAGHAAYAPVLP
jgi:hypothetical protein